MRHEEGRLSARPVAAAHPGRGDEPTGLVPLGLERRRDGWVYVPKGYRPDVTHPLSVKLHGAGSDARAGLAPFLPLADATGLLLLGVDSRGPTWDVIRDGFGPDVAFLDRALDALFRRYTVDPDRISVEGFSDGASYALSVGLLNGDLFSRIVAFSPGFFLAPEAHGRPSIFVSHGVHDRVLPIDRCSRRLVPRLRHAGYDVDYHEFDGGHVVPAELAEQAADWLAG